MKEKKRAPAFQFYADDFLAGTLEMSQAEVGAYIRLLCHQWNRGSIPVEPEKQQRLAGGNVSVDVLAKFNKCEDGLLRNQRLESVRYGRNAFTQQQREKGLKSALARAQAKQRATEGATEQATAVEPEAQPNSQPDIQPEFNSPSPSPINTKNTDPELESFRLRIGSWFKRRPTTQWSERELKALKLVHKLETPTEDLDLLERWYTSGDPYLRRDPITLLNNWNGEIDRARNNIGKPQLFQKPAPDTSKYTKEQIMLMEAMG